MRWIVLLAVLVCVRTASATSIEIAHDLRRQAEAHISAKEYPAARDTLRDAALLARGAGYPALEAACIGRLGQLLRWEETTFADADAAYRLLDTAVTVATRCGARDAELAAWNVLRGRSTADFLANVDAALAWQDYAVLETLWDLTTRLDADDQEAKLAYIQTGMTLADQRARLRLETHAVRVAPGVHTRVIALGQEVAAAGYPRLAQAVLEDGLDLHPDVAEALAALLAPSERYRDWAAAVATAQAPTAPPAAVAAAVARLERAHSYAGAAHATALQRDLATALAGLTGEVRWSTAAAALQQQVSWELIADGQRALRDRWFTYDGLEAALAASEDPAAAAMLLQLRGPAAEVDAAAAARYADALKAALAVKDYAFPAPVLAEIAERHEALPVLVAALQDSGNADTLPWAIESLARQEDLDLLFGLVKHPDWRVQEAAAAALFRLDTRGSEVKIFAGLRATGNNGAGLYLNGCLAKSGLIPALKMLEGEAANADNKDGRRAIAAGILASLGYASPIPVMHALVTKDPINSTVPRALGRMPATWGSELVHRAVKGHSRYAVRAAFLRRDPRRAHAMSVGGVNLNLYLLPRPTEPAGDSPLDSILVFERDDDTSDETRTLIDWGITRSGGQGSEVGDVLHPPQPPATPEAPPTDQPAPAPDLLRELARTERETAPRQSGPRKRLVLIDKDGGGYARCAIEFEVGTATIVDGNLYIPYRWANKIDAYGQYILGVLYRELIIGIASTSILQSATVSVPGYDVGQAHFESGPNGWGAIVAPLPFKSVGDGLGDTELIPLNDLREGGLQVFFDFNGNPGSLQFRLVFAIPQGDKPDLIPEGLSLDPVVPRIGETARVFVRVKNLGAAVGNVRTSTVSFQIRNPQSEDGWRSLGAQVMTPSGWRTGEVRTYELRQKFVEGYYMNTYSYTYTPVGGDTAVAAMVDGINAIEESNEDNNRTELQAPLHLGEERGSALAEAEALAALQQPAEDLKNARSIDDLAAAYGRAYSIYDRLANKTEAVEIMMRHLYSAYELQKSRLRSEAAIRRLQEARAADTLTPDTARAIRRDLIRAQEDILRSGVPQKIETIEKVRNATLAAANLSAANDEFAQLNYAMNSYDSPDTATQDATRLLKGLDAAMLTYLEAERLLQTGEMDKGNVMDAVANSADALDLKLPGFSNLHRALLKAEMDYAEKGMLKEAETIDALGDLIAGEPGARERMNAAAREVETHIKAGPFNEEAMGDIAKGWVKDIPVIGQFADILFSWK